MSGSTITFKQYPVSNRVPGVYAELNNQNANSGQPLQRTIIVAQKLASGTAATGVPYHFSSTTDIQLAMGEGSQAAIMAYRYRKIDLYGDLWILPLADDPASVAATGTVTLTGAATAVGTFPLYIAGVQVFCAVNVGDTPTTVCQNLVTAAGLLPNLPVNVTANAGVLTVTAKNKGAAGNDIDIRLAYVGPPYEASPAGLAATVVKMANGATNPSTALATALSNLAAGGGYDFMATAFNDPTSLTDIGNYFNDTSGTWSWSVETFGHCFAGFNGTFAQAVTLGTSRNDQHMTILPIQNTPTASFAIAADLCAAAAVSLRANPAVPLNGLTLNVLAPPIADRFTVGEQNSLLYDGMSTINVSQQGTVQTQRLVTTYQLNAAGAPDNSYLDVETMYTLMAVIRAIRTQLQSQFFQKILVADGTRIPPGSAMTTAQVILLSVIATYGNLCLQGLCQNAQQFSDQADAVNAGNGLVELYLPIQVANQLRVVAMLVAFSKP
jgi:phage tail sheath gpL-like